MTDSNENPWGFALLPCELRLKIWEMVPQDRLLYLEPCSNCASMRRYAADDLFKWDFRRFELCKRANHSTWDYRWVVHPREMAVPPLLHVCQESRDVGRRIFSTVENRTYIAGAPQGPESTLENKYAIVFGSPFVNYLSDTFVVFPHDTTDYQWTGQPTSVPPFVGFDRGKVRHVAWFEPSLRSAITPRTLSWTNFSALPKIQSLTVLVTDFLIQDGETSCGGLLGLTDATLLDVGSVLEAFVGLRYKKFVLVPFSVESPSSACAAVPATGDNKPPLSLNANLVRAWLWHLRDGKGLYRANGIRDHWDKHILELHRQVMDDELDDMPCPVCIVDSRPRHTTGEIKRYIPPFRIKWAIMQPPAERELMWFERLDLEDDSEDSKE
jgi:hypothetical protein